jgi:hypothetical protein
MIRDRRVRKMFGPAFDFRGLELILLQSLFY